MRQGIRTDSTLFGCGKARILSRATFHWRGWNMCTSVGYKPSRMANGSSSEFLQLSLGMGARLSPHSLISFSPHKAIKGGLFIQRKLRIHLFNAKHPQTFIGLVVRPWSTERRGISPQTSRRRWRGFHAAFFMPRSGSLPVYGTKSEVVSWSLTGIINTAGGGCVLFRPVRHSCLWRHRRRLQRR